MKMRRLLGTAMLPVLMAMAETALPLKNPGMEAGVDGWSGDNGMSRLIPEAARTGKTGLRVVDTSNTDGSSFRSAPLPVTPGRAYALRFWARSVNKSPNTGVYICYRNAKDVSLTNYADKTELIFNFQPAEKNGWKQYTFVTKAPTAAATIYIWIHSYTSSCGGADFDDFTLSLLTLDEEKTVMTTEFPKQRDFPKLDEDKINKIAAMLPAMPRGAGFSASDRARWQPLAESPEAKNIIAWANKNTGIELPVDSEGLYLEYRANGNRGNYESLNGRRHYILENFVKAECLEYKGRFLADIERCLDAILSDRSWVIPAHDSELSNYNNVSLYPDLVCSSVAAKMAYIYWHLRERLKPETLARIKSECMRRAIEPYRTAFRSGVIKSGLWWMRTINNWNAVCTCNLVEASLILLDSPRERAEVLAAMEASNDFFYKGFTADGYCSEGLSYWCYGFGHYLMMGEVVLDATGGKLNIFDDDPVILKACEYARNILIEENIAPAFADCSLNSRPDYISLSIIQRHYPQALLKRVSMGNLLGNSFAVIGLFAFSDESVAQAAAPETPVWPPYSYFEQAGILICRAQDPAQGQFGAAIKAGHNAELHNHNDVGSYLVTLAGTAYLVDPGNEVYTRRTFSKDRYVSNVLNSYGHQVPVVAGKLQFTGAKAKGVITESSFTDTASSILIDMKAAYDVPALESLTRAFRFDYKNRSITLRDEVSFSSPQSFEDALVTFSKVFRRPDGTLVFYDNKGSLAVMLTPEGGELTLRQEAIENPGRPSPTRIGLAFAKPVQKASITFTITPAALTDDLPDIYRKPNTDNLMPRLDEAVTVEAENITAQTGGKVVLSRKTACSGTAFKNWDDAGHALTWSFVVPKEGTYALRLRGCHDNTNDARRSLAVDGTPVADTFIFPYTGGWSNGADNWREEWLAVNRKVVTFRLTTGKHTVTLTNTDGHGLNLDFLTLVPVNPEY